MKPVVERPEPQQKSQERPTLTITRVINIPTNGTFSGWGPKVSGTSSTLKNWN